MGIQSFFKQRKPRQFEHKPIYWDARKEELDKRIERIRAELIASGELEEDRVSDANATIDSVQPEEVSQDMKERVRGGLRLGTEHLQRQHDQGITPYDRAQRMVRLVLMLLALGAIAWLMYSGALDFLI